MSLYLLGSSAIEVIAAGSINGFDEPDAAGVGEVDGCGDVIGVGLDAGD